jgi:type I site-specific restriction endonuclease
MPRAPEQQAREKIDAQLQDCGWIVQDSRKADFSAGRGIYLAAELDAPPPFRYESTGVETFFRQPVLAPFADSVQERFEQWLKRKEADGMLFTSEQRAWLALIRDHIATSLSIEPDDFDYSPFTQHSGLGKAHQLVVAELPPLLEELNEALAA